MKSYFFYTDQLTVGYDGRPLIKEINIQLNKGEILTLIGPNGAGKSTILKSITRQLSLISGTVYLEQEQMSRMTNKEVSRKLAVVLTERMRPELMTCEDVVSTGRYPYTGTLGILSPEDKKKVKNAMEMVHAWDLKDRDFTAISDGQRQRILLARAICQEPEIIILDEPTVGLDPKQIIEIRELIRELAKKHTVILSSHILAEIREVCDFILIISKGKLVASDTPDRLEEKMSGTETVEILAKASAAEVRAILLNVEHISNIHTQERADKTCSARIQTEGGCDIREALFFAFAKNECPLLELQTSRISLEEVFLELTQNDAVGEEERTNAGNL